MPIDYSYKQWAYYSDHMIESKLPFPIKPSDFTEDGTLTGWGTSGSSGIAGTSGYPRKSKDPRKEKWAFWIK